jgi:ankyrin repeat protein
MACKAGRYCVFITLSHHASDRFRFVFCQLEILRHSLPPSVRGILMGLPETLDETYERILRQIPKSNQVYAHRLLQCLSVALRPLCVDELAEVLAIDFSVTGGIPKVDEHMRWEDQEQAVLSACSSLISVIEYRGSCLVQFSHFSVREFLMSDRLAASNADTLQYHHIHPRLAHTIMAQACLAVLLHLDKKMDTETIENYPLAKYAGYHLGAHTEFEDVLSHIMDGMDVVLDPDKPHFDMWVWLQIGDWEREKWHNFCLTGEEPSRSAGWYRMPQYPPQVSPLYYVAALGQLSLAKHVISKRPQDLHTKDAEGCTPLHIAVLAGNVEVSQLLLSLSHPINSHVPYIKGYNLLHMAAWKGHFKITRMLLEHDESMKLLVNTPNNYGQTPLHLASTHDHASIVALLLKFGADMETRDGYKMTPLQCASGFIGSGKAAQLLLERGANFGVQNEDGQMPLHLASMHNHPNIVALLLKLGAPVDLKDSNDMTPLLCALESFGSGGVVQLLLEHGASVNARNKRGWTPLHSASASEETPPDVVASLLKLGADVDALDNDNMTPLLCAFEWYGSNEIAQLLMEHGAGVHVRNKKSQTPLHLASRWRHTDVLASLLKLGADVDSSDSDGMTPLLHALVHQNQSSAVKLLLKHGASVHVRNRNGQMPLHLASQSCRSDIVASLLKLGADVDAQDSSHMTPLHFALSSRSPYRFIEYDMEGNGRAMEAEPDVEMDEETLVVIELLLEHGANVHLQNDHGKTPLQIAPVKMKHKFEQSCLRCSQK